MQHRSTRKMHPDDDGPTTTDLHGEASSTRQKLLDIKDRAQKKTKRALHIKSSNDDADRSSYDAGIEELNESPAFNPSKFLNRERIGQSGLRAKALSAIQGTVGAIVNPKAAITSRATKTTAGTLAKSRPYLSHKADLDFLEAHDDLKRAEGSRSEIEEEEEAVEKARKIDQYEEHLAETERGRLNMRVAWMTARHVQRVRRVDAVPPPPFPEDSFFEQQDDYGFTEFNWGKWIGYKLLSISHPFTAQYIDDFDELPFDLETLRRHVERLIIVSAPLQTFLSEVRCIYRWENPARTGRWMALYFLLWYISHIVTFFYGYVFYKVVMNYYYPTSLKDLREEIQRTIDRSATAFKVGELMDKHGSDDWLGALMDELGPYIQIQVADFASFLEACYNFYHFRSPPATIASLILWAALFLTSAMPDSRFAMKVFWLIVGLYFFIAFPISSLHPRYRLLVSPWKWTLWDVPTHAEWCFQYLQERAEHAKDAILAHQQDFARDDSDSDSDESFCSAQSWPDDEEERDIISFSCTYFHTPGRFVISTHSIRFVSSIKPLPSKTFRKPFSSLVEMSKRKTRSSILSPLAKVTAGMDKLELHFRSPRGEAGIHSMGEKEDAEVVLLENMRERDKAFNAVIGFSGLRWQHLQQSPPATKNRNK